MDAKKFIACAKKTHLLQPVFLKFNRDGITGVSRLIGLTRSCPGVRIDQGDLTASMAVEMSQDWGNERNRTIKVHGLCHVHPALLEPMARDIEQVSVPDHGAKALFTSRVRTFEEAAAKITREVITLPLRAEIEGWGLNIFSDPRTQRLEDGLPGIDFTLRDADGGVLVTVTLDGWSGRMAVNGVFGDELYVQPKQLEKLIRTSLEACLERMTTA
ncbi:MAG: hypothetical protein A2664_04230 [Candidatus Taylorbacteria bacterium RIFCSPHIGHO2_01_FULL_46_22b]|uniref:Uncharacterized protein n=1 Tax=Candidatus Taylorbacteria bacterium RIFCSPHIGHO2_01_FULL_46_22b TaxID=1802301 RepID=A0A1G2M1Z0_9BACT|nr:MAG: hypothetical protein A2664_04230 [Candidatus Taylorbacteria bacterium RIFCSPHIGHO2_01_FULL_46_22b]